MSEYKRQFVDSTAIQCILWMDYGGYHGKCYHTPSLITCLVLFLTVDRFTSLQKEGKQI